MTQQSVAPITRTFTVRASTHEAFRMFTEQLQAWWPAEYSWSGEVLESIGMEPREGGRCTEYGPHGFQCDWGRVLVWEPPRRLVLAWQISPSRAPEPDPAKASEIELRINPERGNTTRVAFEHRHFKRHGEDGAGYRAALDTPEGWSYMLERYRTALS